MTKAENQLLAQIAQDLLSIKSKLPSGDINLLIEEIKYIKKDLSELKDTLLDPESGVVVKTNKNTDQISYQEQIRSKETVILTALQQEVNDLKLWKNNIGKVLWGLFAGITALIVNVISGKV